ncbi:MAG: SAM-dependent chlorinase/fluorinase [Candidatus Dormibacteraeota bacterium]|nr:SAM-dependent chlorinase/fluorinase [Candidatus Dormibacteraeota bacterium]
MSAIVTVTSDFGEGSPYVSAMVGVMLARVPDARVTVLSSTVPPFDVLSGAVVLWAGTRHWPPAAVHLAVIDPGVGTSRRAVALRCGGSWYVGPDNGLFGLLVSETPGGVDEVWNLARPPGASATFEGRDVFAPAAAALAAGVPPAELGSPAAPAVASLPGSGPRVLWVDHFGNLLTDLRSPPAALRLGTSVVEVHARTFGEAPPGTPFLYRGSMGFWEIGVREGRADRLLGARSGTPLQVLR